MLRKHRPYGHRRAQIAASAPGRRREGRQPDGRLRGGASPSLPAATLALLPDAAASLVAMRGADGTVIDFTWCVANPAAETLIGRAPLAGLRLRGDGTDRRCPDLFAALTAGLDGARVQTLDAWGEDGGPRQRWRLAASPCPGGVCATLIDLGPRTPTMAETLATALEHSAESFALFDAADRLVHATSRLKDFLPELADLLAPGVPFEALVRRAAHRDDTLPTNAERELWIETRLAHHRQADKPFTVRAQGGRWLLVSEHGLPDGGVLVIYADVTAMKRSEERVQARETEARAARLEAERANRAKSDFLAHMSHELRTPLNAVLGFSELLITEAFGPLGNPRYRAYATDIRDSGAHLLALINDILDLSRVESGRMPLADDAVDLADLASEVLPMLRDAAAAKPVALTSDLAGDLPILLCDSRAIRQMMLNLLSNAVKFTPPGGRVTLSMAVMPDGGVGIMVADNGAGIPAADLARVQEPFERADVTIARTTEGSGLGLPIVKRLIERHGGRLDLSSELGVGTSAVLIFPASRSVPRGLCAPAPLPALL